MLTELHGCCLPFHFLQPLSNHLLSTESTRKGCRPARAAASLPASVPKASQVYQKCWSALIRERSAEAALKSNVLNQPEDEFHLVTWCNESALCDFKVLWHTSTHSYSWSSIAAKIRNTLLLKTCLIHTEDSRQCSVLKLYQRRKGNSFTMWRYARMNPLKLLKRLVK